LFYKKIQDHFEERHENSLSNGKDLTGHLAQTY